MLKHLLYLQLASPQVQLVPKFNCCLALVQLLACLAPTDPLVHYNRVFDVVRVVGSQQRALAFLAGIDFDEPHCCVATLLVGTCWSVFYTVFPQKCFFTWLGDGRPNERCSHSDEI